MKRFVCFLLAVLLLLSVVPNSVEAKKKKKPKLNTTYLSLEKGDTYQLKVLNYKGKIEWSSSNSAVTVDKKGFITCLEEKNSFIYAKLPKKGCRLYCIINFDDSLRKNEQAVRLYFDLIHFTEYMKFFEQLQERVFEAPLTTEYIETNNECLKEEIESFKSFNAFDELEHSYKEKCFPIIHEIIAEIDTQYENVLKTNWAQTSISTRYISTTKLYELIEKLKVVANIND